MAQIDVPIPAELLDPDALVAEIAGELDDAIMLGAELPERVQRFTVSNIGQAEWAMRKLRVLRDRAAEIGSHGRAWRERISEWERDELARLDPGVRFFESRLESYALAERAARPKEATVHLPSGFITTTLPKTPVIDVDDEDAVLGWAADCLDGDEYEAVVKTTLKVLLPEFRRRVKAVETLRPYCLTCGALLEEEPDNGDGVRVWRHADAGDCEQPEPTAGFMVVDPRTGAVVPGAHAYLRDPGVKVTVVR
jgi:hypothetical protein